VFASKYYLQRRVSILIPTLQGGGKYGLIHSMNGMIHIGGAGKGLLEWR
jgi:hypothetical protein